MSYTVEQNILNQGSLSGKYALKDLSNTGKYTGYVNKVPVRRNVTCSFDGGTYTITVGNGSIFTVPNGITETDSGARECEYMRISRDLNITVHFSNQAEGEIYDTSRYVYILYDTETNQLIAARGNAEYSGGDISINQVITELKKTTISYAYYTVKVNSHKCSLPIGYFDGKLNWHTFDAIGFLGSIFWVEEDVEGIFPEGRDYTSNYKTSRVSNQWLMFTQFTAADAHPIPSGTTCLMLNKSGKVTPTDSYNVRDTFSDIAATDGPGYYLVLDENYMYYKPATDSTAFERVTKCVKLCDVTFNNSNSFTSISNINMYKPITIDPIESKVRSLSTAVEGIQEIIGDISVDDFLNKNTGGTISGKTDYVMSGDYAAAEIVNLLKLQEVLMGYAPLNGAAFSGEVSVPTPDVSDDGQATNVGFVKSLIQSMAMGKNFNLGGVVSGSYGNNTININVFTQQNFIDLFNKIAPNFGKAPISLAKNTWYYFSIPGWIQWNSSENVQRNALRLGSSPSNYYLVSQVAAWAGNDSCASAGLVPVAAGQWAYNYKHSGSKHTPVARFFPFVGYTGTYKTSGKKNSTAYNVNYYQIQA